VRLGEASEAVDQPLCGEVGRGADRQHARALPLLEALGAERDPVESIAQDGEIFAALLGDDQTLALANE